MSQSYEHLADSYPAPGERAEQVLDEETLRTRLIEAVIQETVGTVGLIMSADFSDDEKDAMLAARRSREAVARSRYGDDVPLAGQYAAAELIHNLDRYGRWGGGHHSYGERPVASYDAQSGTYKDRASGTLGDAVLMATTDTTIEAVRFVDNPDGETVEARYGVNNRSADGSGRMGNKIIMGFTLSRYISDMLYTAAKIDPSLLHRTYREQSLALGIHPGFWASTMAPQYGGAGYPKYPQGQQLDIGSYDADLTLRERGQYPLPPVPHRRRRLSDDADFVRMWNGEQDASAGRIATAQRAAETEHWFELQADVDRMEGEGASEAAVMLHVLLNERRMDHGAQEAATEGSVRVAETRGRWSAAFEFANRRMDAMTGREEHGVERLARMAVLVREVAGHYVEGQTIAYGSLPDAVAAPTYEDVADVDAYDDTGMLAEVLLDLQERLADGAVIFGLGDRPQEQAQAIIDEALRADIAARRAAAAAGAAGVRGTIQT